MPVLFHTSHTQSKKDLFKVQICVNILKIQERCQCAIVPTKGTNKDVQKTKSQMDTDGYNEG